MPDTDSIKRMEASVQRQEVAHQVAVKEGHIPFIFQSTADTILKDGWMLKDAYSDFIEDEREDLGLDTDLRWNTEFVRKVKERYFSGAE